MKSPSCTGSWLLKLGGNYGNTVRDGCLQVSYPFVYTAAEIYISQDGGNLCGNSRSGTRG